MSILRVLDGTHNPMSLFKLLIRRDIKTVDEGDQWIIDGLQEVFFYLLKELDETDIPESRKLQLTGRIMAKHFTMQLKKTGHPYSPSEKYNEVGKLTRKSNTPFDVKEARVIYVKELYLKIKSERPQITNGDLDKMISDQSFKDGFNLGIQTVKHLRQLLIKRGY
ncbi:hypothetical protein [Thalassotalea maritima]|uniref:hypothetical protein n=1 Tax=Thalassotalea maritima TaxID=3242416 RepID=UPI0035284562